MPKKNQSNSDKKPLPLNNQKKPLPKPDPKLRQTAYERHKESRVVKPKNIPEKGQKHK